MITALLLATILYTSDVLACAVCFEGATGAMVDGINWAIITLLIFICGILALFAKFFLTIRKRLVYSDQSQEISNNE